MPKKDYIIIAQVLKEHVQEIAPPGSPAEGANDALVAIRDSLADIFQLDNPHFDRQRFLAACE